MRSSSQWRLVKASLGQWKPNTVAVGEWISETLCENYSSKNRESAVKRTGYRVTSVPAERVLYWGGKRMETFRPFEEEVFFWFCSISAKTMHSPFFGDALGPWFRKGDTERKERQSRAWVNSRELIWVAPRLHRPIIGDVVAFFVPKIPWNKQK